MRRWKRIALRDISTFFVPINSRKISVRELRMKGYEERSVNILKREKRGFITRKLQALKKDLI